MPPRPDDNYSPNNSVAPETNMPSDYLQTRATPEAFGSQIGQAEEKAGSTLDKLGGQAIDVATQQQGVINEHAVNMADMALATQGGVVYQKYKNLTGFDAVNAKDQAVADYTQVANKIRESLGNPAAQRGFDQLANRRLSFTIQDMNAYAATEQKQALKTGAAAGIGLAESEASRYEVATNSAQLGDSLGAIVSKANYLFTAPDVGEYQTLPAKTDPKTGKVQFDTSTPQGASAQANYDNYLQIHTGNAIKNAALTIAYSGSDGKSGNIVAASKFLTDHQKFMSSASYGELSRSFASGVANEDIRGNVDQLFSNTLRDYRGTSEPSKAPDVSGIIPGSVVTSTIRTPEENAKLPGAAIDSLHISGRAADFIPPQGMTIDQAKAAFTAKGYNITEAIDQKDNPSTGEKAHFHIGWAPRQGDAVGPASGQSEADFLGTHQDALVQRARDLYPGDAAKGDAAAARMETHISQVVQAAHAVDRANENTVLTALQSGKVKFVDNLINSPDPQLKQAWISASTRNPNFGLNVETHLIPALAKGSPTTYGTGYWQNYLNTNSGRMTSSDLVGQVDAGNNKNSPLTSTGYTHLSKIMERNQTPEGHAFGQAEQQFLEGQHKNYTGAGLVSGVNLYSSNSDWDRAVQEMIPKIEAGRAAGKSAQQLFSPKISGKDNPDYITSSVQPRSIAALTAPNFKTLNQINSNSDTNKTIKAGQAKNPAEFLIEAKGRGLTKAQYLAEGTSRGFFNGGVPRPGD